MSDAPGSKHRFKIGQTVTITSGTFEARAPGETFKVIRQLPAEGRAIPYRIQSTRDRHERVVDEGQLRT